MNECSVDGCNRPMLLTLPLCKQHRKYQLLGKELKPITKSGGHNVKYGPDAECKAAGCSERPTANWLCIKHYGKSRYTPREELLVDAPKWSKVCSKCKKVKTWDQFVRWESQRILCLECYRTPLADEPKKRNFNIKDVFPDTATPLENTDRVET